ncbi:hypothetical protein AVEN_40545-1 [Araneus ventricosus]|uniref:Uncharacterized protein n=1 Tax=Araneus ventricosus TaxID=182803 RepID=A0A4Y2V974_ARAVE|nr:hypothetical protein AVEN_40545-1 [Araneus ventricosus]
MACTFDVFVTILIQKWQTHVCFSEFLIAIGMVSRSLLGLPPCEERICASFRRKSSRKATRPHILELKSGLPQVTPVAARQLRNKQCCKSHIHQSCRKFCAVYFGI